MMKSREVGGRLDLQNDLWGKKHGPAQKVPVNDGRSGREFGWRGETDISNSPVKHARNL
jgi:hypothetical protein